MWIRSQNKTELINTNRIQVDGNSLYVFEGIAVEDTDYIRIGSYDNANRALEVLDMIQNQIVVGTSSDVIIHGKRIMQENVFKMPAK